MNYGSAPPPSQLSSAALLGGGGYAPLSTGTSVSSVLAMTAALGQLVATVLIIYATTKPDVAAIKESERLATGVWIGVCLLVLILSAVSPALRRVRGMNTFVFFALMLFGAFYSLYYFIVDTKNEPAKINALVSGGVTVTTLMLLALGVGR